MYMYILGLAESHLYHHNSRPTSILRSLQYAVFRFENSRHSSYTKLTLIENQLQIYVGSTLLQKLQMQLNSDSMSDTPLIA